MKKLSREEIGELGMYEFQAYIGAMTSPTFGGWKGSDRLLESLRIEDIKCPKILELGCSTGYITQYVAKNYDCEIIGVDLSELVLEIAREEAEKLNLTNISFQAANVEKLPFPDNSFDLIYGEAITALVPDPLKAIKEYKRVLKPRGKIGTLDLYMKRSLTEEMIKEINEIMTMVIGVPVKIRDHDEWEQIFTSSGLKEIKIHDYDDDLFKTSYGFGKLMKILFKMLYYMIRIKKIRQKITPAIKFAKKFKARLKEGNFGYFIFTGSK